MAILAGAWPSGRRGDVYRPRRTFARVTDPGLRVDSGRGDVVVRPVQATDDPRQVGVVDVVLVGEKAWQVPEVADAIRPLVGATTCVIPLQNGVEAPEQLAAALGRREDGGYVAWSALSWRPAISGMSHQSPSSSLGHGQSSQARREYSAPGMSACWGDGRHPGRYAECAVDAVPLDYTP